MVAEIKLRVGTYSIFTTILVSLLTVTVAYHFVTLVTSFYICNEDSLLITDICLLQGL